MLETSKDLVWIALAFAILWISIFAGWGLYYMAMILRDINKMTISFRKKMTMLDDILSLIKNKIDSTANYLPPLVEGIAKLVEKVREKKEEAKEKKSKRKK